MEIPQIEITSPLNLLQRNSSLGVDLRTPARRRSRRNSIFINTGVHNRRGPRRSVFGSSFKSMFNKKFKKKRLNILSRKSSAESITSTERAKRKKADERFKVKLLYIPKKAILESEERRGKFKSFNSIEGRKEFMEKSVKRFGENSLSVLNKKLGHNSRTQKSYVNFYKSKHRKALSAAINDIQVWEKRQKKMPKVKVIKSSRKKNSSSLPILNIPLKYSKTISGKISIPEEERKKKVRNYTVAWKKMNKDFPLESREGASFTFCGGYAWLIGGMNHQIIEKIWKFDVNDTGDIGNGNNFEEIELKNTGMNMPRFNHSAIAWEKKIYFFGGERFASNSFYSRVCLNDVRVLDICKKKQILFSSFLKLN